MAKNKVLVIAPSKQTRGGITAVINQYTTTDFWLNWSCKWIETQIDRGSVLKLGYFLKGFFQFLYYLPFYQIIHVHLSEPASAFRKCFFIIPSLIFGKKVIIHFHSFSVETTINGRFKMLYSFLFKKVKCVIVLSEYWAMETKKYIGDDVNVLVVYNPCPAPLDVPSSTEKENMILFAGTLNDRKGFKDLITAFGTIANEYPSWKLVLAGNGEIEQGKKMVNALNLDNQIFFSGWIANAEKDQIFKSASIFCLPSYAEGLPMAVLDAMAYQIPVISTPVGGILDFLNDEEHALIFTPGDISALSDKLKRLMESSELRLKLANSAKVIVANDFNINNITNKIDGLYHKLIE